MTTVSVMKRAAACEAEGTWAQSSGNDPLRSHHRRCGTQLLVLGTVVGIAAIPVALLRSIVPLSQLAVAFTVSSDLARGRSVHHGHLRSHLPRSAFNLGDLFGGAPEFEYEIPKKVDAVLAGLKQSTEVMLNLRNDRLDIELPPGYRLGVEGNAKGRLYEAGSLKDDIDAADRELARVFAEMLQPIGAGIVIAFRTKALVRAAKKKWKHEMDEGKLMSFPESKFAFATEVGSEQFIKQMLESNCQCLLVVAPRIEQLRVVEELSKAVGNQMGIFLLNARVRGESSDVGKSGKSGRLPTRLHQFLKGTFKPSYHIRFLPFRKNALLFRMQGTEKQVPWIVAQQRQLPGGIAITNEVLRKDSEEEPDEEEISAAFKAYDARPAEMSDTLVELLAKDKPETPGS
eukprot:TRINITY_DN6059_c0_g1_i1.p1 TRINITY_DN6059_c0_g1~~TRINITY_DN6059_c0_g1_i1.p1  ORF type:complete len:401 (+),score=54.25 TRINITY_DN6059_c0_g1_i1:81-1283(+)